MFSVELITDNQFARLRELRLAALRESPDWFAGDFAAESARSDEEWLEVLRRDYWFALLEDEKPVGLMAISDREAGRGTDCWLFSCWINPAYRGQGLLHLLMKRFDDECQLHGWRVQGLGVWPENVVAIKAYERIGFEQSGEPKPSRIKPGQFYQLMRRTLPNI
jgi:RimJ/RimL family protein N-acetyltransferase